MASPDYEYDDFLRFLRWMEIKGVWLYPYLKAPVHTLRLKHSFLLVFLSCEGKHNKINENRHFQFLLLHIRTVLQSLDLEIGRRWADIIEISSKESWLAMDMDDFFSSLLQRIELLKPDFQDAYIILSKSSRSTTIGGDRDAAISMKNLNSLLENIEDLLTSKAEMVAPVKDELEVTKKSLRFLRDLLAFTAKRCSEVGKLRDLILHAEFLAYKISCLLFLCSVNKKMNYRKLNEMKMHLSSELQNFSAAQQDVRQIYIKSLKASKLAKGDSALVEGFDLGFVESLRDNIMQLPDTNNDQILSLYEDLLFLTMTLAQVAPNLDHYSFPSLLHIHDAIIDMGCLVYLLHNNERNTDEAKELKIAVSDLQDFIKTAKDDARKAYDMYIPKSWKPKTRFRRANAQEMVSFLMKTLEKLRVLSSSTLFIPLALKMLQKEMLSLIEAFRNLTAKQHAEHQLDIQMMHLNDIRNETNNLAEYRIGLGISWRSNLWLFVLFEEIKTIKLEFEDLQNKMVHDTSVTKLPIRNINAERKKTAIDYQMISKDEAEKIGEQMIINGSLNAGMPQNEDQLRWLENNLICPLRDEVKAFRFMVGFLKVFLSSKGKWYIEDAKLQVLLKNINNVFQNAYYDLQRLWADMIQISPKEGWCLPVNMDCLFSSVLARFQLLKSDIQEVYTILPKSSRFIACMSDEIVMENLNFLLENIEDLLTCNAEFASPMKEQLEVVQKSLRFLRNFLGFTAKRCSKLGKFKDLLIHVELLVDNMSCLLYLSCIVDKVNDRMVNELKLHLLSELQKISPAQPEVTEIYIRALKASKSAQRNSTLMDEFDLGFLDSLRDNILELSNTNLSFTTSIIDQVPSLLEELKFLITFFAVDKSSEEQDQTFNYLFERLNALIIDAGCVIYSLNDEEKNGKMTRELELDKKVTDFIANFMNTKADIRKIYQFYVPKSLQFDFPRTKGEGFIRSLFQNLKELLNTKVDLVAPLELHIEMVRKDLMSLWEDFNQIAKQPSQSEELQNQWTRFLDIAYQTEFIIDSFLVGGDPIYYHQQGLFNVLEEIKRIKIELKAIRNKTREDTLVHKPSCFSTQISVESNFPNDNAILSSKERLADENSTTKLVIFGEEEKKIGEQLTSGPRKLHIISIVGMPGIGKTTLANSMFQHSSITYHFHARARCSVTQVHDKRRLLLEILRQVNAASKKDDDDDCYKDLDHKLYKSLKGRRYLILMDDVWNISPWEDIKASLPDDENGSRIIFTSRFEDIATQAELGSTTYHLLPLSEEKCWEMLKVKLFGKRSCPPELVMVGREIAAKCKGLPLTIDLIAGVLRVKERKNWKKVAESLMTILLKDPQGQCQRLLELSYKNLPDDLKPCFLYFAAFPEDEDVPTRKLISLWIAEGFVQLGKDEPKSLEDAAEDILNNLINRSLVTISRSRPLGGVDASRVHDLLHEFVVAKAQEESFMLKIDGNVKFSTSSSVGVHDQWREQYRLCIYPDNWVQFLESNPSGPRTRALISSFSLVKNAYSLNISNFKLLKVLHITQLIHGYYPAMFTLIHLRVLTIDRFRQADAFNVISKIHKLQNLESFIMEEALSTKPALDLLLDKICSLSRLRNFCFGGYLCFRYHSEKIWEMSSLFDNLRTLYHLRVSYEEDIEKILKLMPNLVELKVIFHGPNEVSYPFPRLDLFKKLESLELEFDSNNWCCPCKMFNFPPQLNKLVLSNLRLPWTDISEIGNLEYLEILELKDRAISGPIWDMIDGQFPKLKYLKLSYLDIEEWNASKDHLSCLEQLHLSSCYELKELPSCLEEIPTLQVIGLLFCSKSAKNSAKRIQEEQQLTGNEHFMIESFLDDLDLSGD